MNGAIDEDVVDCEELEDDGLDYEDRSIIQEFLLLLIYKTIHGLVLLLPIHRNATGLHGTGNRN